jgi:hypothetical protein
MTDEDVNEDQLEELEPEDEEEEGEEGEPSEELLQLMDMSASITEDLTRLKALQKKGKLQGEVLGAEVVSTVMPLLLSLCNAVVEHASSTEEWGEGVDATLDAVEQGALGSAAAEETLTQTEVELFKWLFVRFKEFLAGALQAPEMAEEMRNGLQEIDAKLNQAALVLQRFEELEDEQQSRTEEKEDRDSSSQEQPTAKSSD